jgi:hypothetical protein
MWKLTGRILLVGNIHSEVVSITIWSGQLSSNTLDQGDTLIFTNAYRSKGE